MKTLMAVLMVTLVLPVNVWAQNVGTAEENLKQKNIKLPAAASPVANYVPAVRVGNLLFLSGAGPGPNDPRGKVGKELTLDQGYQAARATGLNLLAATRAATRKSR
jgi:enamine deaminase RidA (YjgF/YER057c/UK114 family)